MVCLSVGGLRSNRHCLLPENSHTMHARVDGLRSSCVWRVWRQ